MQRPGAHSPEAGKPPDALGWRDEDPRDVFRLQLDQASLRVVLQHVRRIALVNAEADRRALEHQEAGDEQYGVPGMTPHDAIAGTRRQLDDHMDAIAILARMEDS